MLTMVSSDKAYAYYESPRRTKKCIMCVYSNNECMRVCVVKYVKFEHPKTGHWHNQKLTNYHLASVHNDFITYSHLLQVVYHLVMSCYCY